MAFLLPKGIICTSDSFQEGKIIEGDNELHVKQVLSNNLKGEIKRFPYAESSCGLLFEVGKDTRTSEIRKTTHHTMEQKKKQLQRLGFGYDDDDEVGSFGDNDLDNARTDEEKNELILRIKYCMEYMWNL